MMATEENSVRKLKKATLSDVPDKTEERNRKNWVSLVVFNY